MTEALGLDEDAEGYATNLDAERRLPAAIHRGFGPELADAPDEVEHTGTPEKETLEEAPPTVVDHHQHLEDHGAISSTPRVLRTSSKATLRAVSK